MRIKIPNKNHGFLFGSMVLIILHSIMPIVGRIISTYLTTYFLLLVVLLIWMNAIFKAKCARWIFNPISIIALIKGIESFFYQYEGSFTDTGYAMLLGYCPIIIAFYCKDRLPPSDRKVLYAVTVTSMCVTIVTTLIFATVNTGLVRYAASVADADDAVFIKINWMNIAGFSFVYMFLCVYPLIIAFLKNTGSSWLKQLAVFILLAYFFIRTEFAIAVIVFIATSTIWLFPATVSPKKIIATVFSLIILFLLVRVPIADFCTRYAESTGSYDLRERFMYIADSLNGIYSESGVGRRAYVYMRALRAITQYPILGIWWRSGIGASGHSFTLDFIAYYGVTGWILLIWSYQYIMKTFYAPYRGKPYYGYAIVSVFVAILLSSVNTGDHWLELVLFNPLLLEVIERRRARRTSNELGEST